VSAKFKFGLERVRELREHAEDQAREHLAASLSQRMRGAAELARVTGELQAAAAATPSQPGARISGADLVAHALWLQSLERHRETAALHLDRLDTDVDHRRSLLGQARQDREVLERLKERKQREHTAELARRESAELDEIGMAGRARRQREAARQEMA
jgi:flagellar FliJ protein